jgi:hypothetical protein
MNKIYILISDSIKLSSQFNLTAPIEQMQDKYRHVHTVHVIIVFFDLQRPHLFVFWGVFKFFLHISIYVKAFYLLQCGIITIFIQTQRFLHSIPFVNKTYTGNALASI